MSVSFVEKNYCFFSSTPLMNETSKELVFYLHTKHVVDLYQFSICPFDQYQTNIALHVFNLLSRSFSYFFLNILLE